ncbi:glycosyltransferase [Prauserella cavernicola]|uniref:Glycosyltransferase n=1 Tax=Prauserella cavernicola TaxID=2800127 RepID=A0A934QRM8_9PSEU|nr:glycosyltransferase [Prauserella cavernicola]MBK1784124.1 glycosyltransferase [Prauserella cavernicola]
MRVVVVHNRYRSEHPSGEDRVVDQETELLTSAGHEVLVHERRSDDIAGMSLPRKASVPLLVPWNPAARTELADRLREVRPDVVHIHSTFPLLSPSVVAACTDAGVPCVATLHNYQQVCAPGTLYREGRVCTDCVGGSPLPAVRHGCYRGSPLATAPLALSLALNRRRWWSGVSRFFCISWALRRVLADAGMPGERLAVKYNFVEEPALRRTGEGEYVLYLGRLTEEKGVPLLLAAWDLLRARGGLGLPLVVAGSGPLEPEVAEWARERDDVRFLGLRTREECAELTARAAALVAPSQWLEGFGLVVVEAMAAGVPSVAAGHGAFPELVDDGVSGLLHRPGDAESLAEGLRRIVTHSASMGEAARRRYEQDFSPAAGLSGLLEGYRAAIAARSREPA